MVGLPLQVREEHPGLHSLSQLTAYGQRVVLDTGEVNHGKDMVAELLGRTIPTFQRVER